MHFPVVVFGPVYQLLVLTFQSHSIEDLTWTHHFTYDLQITHYVREGSVHKRMVAGMQADLHHTQTDYRPIEREREGHSLNKTEKAYTHEYQM